MFALPQFEVDIERTEQAASLILRGEVDIATTSRIKLARDTVLDDPPAELVIDLRAVTFVDSNGIRLLLDTYRLGLGASWELKLVRPSDQVMRVFEITGADQHLPFVD